MSSVSFKKFIEDPLEYVDDITIEQLEKFLRKLADLYYNADGSPIPDKIFDVLKEKLADRDPGNPFLFEVGAPIIRDKVKLPFPMGSLNKVKPDNKEFDKWFAKYKGPYELSDKMDGISALVHKTKNNVRLYSRGDGIYGQDISHLLEYINVDTSKMPIDTAVRGELIMTKKNFEKIKNKMKNARNAVAGVVNSKTLDTKVAKLVDFITYNVVHPVLVQSEQYDALEKWGFTVVPHKELKKCSVEILIDYFTERRKINKYDIDGIVVMDNSGTHKVTTGNPKYGFAFKSIMEDQYTVATVVDVEWEVSRYGYLKPRVKIEPIELVGVTITYATAHNAKFIQDNKIGVGSKIKIIRSGDVIPKIMEVITPSKNGKPKMPDVDYEWNDTNVDIMVTDASDEDKLITITKQMVNTMKTLNVKYIDEGLMRKLVSDGYTNLIKLLGADKQEIDEIIGEKMSTKILDGLDDALSNTQLHTLMASSNYFGRGLGEKKLHVVTKMYPDILKKNWNEKELYDKLINLDGFQDITVRKFISGFIKFKKFFVKLNDYYDMSYLISANNETKKGSTMAAQKIVMTGFRSKEISDFIESNGGSVVGSVSKNTTLVLTADEPETSSKLEKAQELNIPIMTKSEFIRKFMK